MGNGHRKVPAWAGSLADFEVIGRGAFGKNRAARGKRPVSPVRIETLEARQLLSTSGSPDLTLGTNGTALGDTLESGRGAHQLVAVQSDGKIVEAAAGAINETNLRFVLARYNNDGTLDLNFGTNGIVFANPTSGDNTPESIAIQANGKIVVDGEMNYQVGVIRYNSDGSLDTSFANGGVSMPLGSGGLQHAGKVLIQGDGKILVCGEGTDSAMMVMRLNTDGTLDSTFGNGGISTVRIPDSNGVPGGVARAYGMTIMPNGDILAVGQTSGNYSDAAVACFTPAGALDTSFHGTGYFSIDAGAPAQPNVFYDVAMQSDGKFVCCGYSNLGYGNTGVLDRFNADGTEDSSFHNTDGLGLPAFAGAIAVGVQRDGLIVIETGSNETLERFSTSGLPDTTFGNNGTATNSNIINTFSAGMVITGDGKILTASVCTTDMSLARYLITPPPVAVANGPYNVNTQSSITLSGAGSYDPNGESITYAWDTNYDGVTFHPTLTGVSPTFSAVGISACTRTVALQITDYNGATSSIARATLHILPVAPTAAVSASAYTVNEATPVTVTGTATDVDPTDTYSYSWHVTDDTGQVIADGNTANWTFTPASVGSYTATLTVTDAFGSTATAAAAITALHVAPSVSISGAAPYASRGDLYTLNLLAVEVGYEAITGWTVNWGDGTSDTYSGNPRTATHTFLSAGSMTINATATDAYGTYAATAPVSSATAAGIYYDLAAANHSAAANVNNAAAGNIVDNNSNTEWTSGNVTANPNQWVYVDLGAAYNISDIKLNWDTAYAATYKIRISNDSCNWNDLSTTQNGAAGLVDVGNLNGTGRYLLVQMFSLSGSNTGYALKDIYVYGSDDLATNRPVFASYNQSTAANTLDTSNSTEWTSTNTLNQWVFVDLGEVYNIQTVKVNFDHDYPTQFSICTSCDTTNWTQISGSPYGKAGLNLVNNMDGNGRYVMIWMPNCANNTDIKISDLEVNGTYDLTMGRPTTVSSYAPPLTGGGNAVDGNLSTAWNTTAAGTQSIYADLGSPYDVTRVTLNWGANYPSQFQIQVSPDASNWSTIYTTPSGGFAGGTFDQGLIYGDGRYVRVLATSGAGSSYSLNEFAVYGSANLALQRPMTASSAAANHGAPYASDQDPTTSWISAAGGTQWLTTDLGAAFTVTNVTINFDANAASSFTIAISSDNVNWSTLTTITSGHAGMNQIAGLNGAGRYLKVIENSGPGSNYQIDDLYIFGH